MTYEIKITLQDKLDVLHLLNSHIGQGNRISKTDMCKRLHISDRMLRAVVHEINSDNTDNLVLTDVSEGGYWKATSTDDPEIALRHYDSEHSRAMTLLEKTKYIKHKIERIYPQPGQGRLC